MVKYRPHTKGVTMICTTKINVCRNTGIHYSSIHLFKAMVIFVEPTFIVTMRVHNISTLGSKCFSFKQRNCYTQFLGQRRPCKRPGENWRGRNQLWWVAKTKKKPKKCPQKALPSVFIWFSHWVFFYSFIVVSFQPHPYILS